MTSPFICIHLDLKGMVHRHQYWPQYMADLASQGINSLLVEYEDTFPFEGVEIASDPSTSFSCQQLDEFLAAAAANGIEIIPLQQCLGHLEYLFRWSDLLPLAEADCYPSTLDLNNGEGRALVLDMLEQVIAAHPDSEYIHLGMDEAHGLNKAAEKSGRTVLDIYVEWVEELLAVTERHGKKAIIWSDMLEDHFELGLLDRLRGRVVLNTWDYVSSGKRSLKARICGWRISRDWLERPDDPAAPAIGEGTPFIEDLPDEIKELIAPYRHGEETDTFFQVNMWTRLGFEVLGATAIRSSSHGAVIPHFHLLFGNIRGFSEAIRADNQLGVIGTSWARGNTFCPNNFPIEIAWPAVTVTGAAMGASPVPFYGEIDYARLELLLQQLGRSRDDWSLEKSVLAELEQMAPAVTSHRYEWDCLLLMIRTMALHRQIAFVLSEVSFFNSAARPPAAEWQRRLDDQEAARQALIPLRAETREHFAQRYHGEHFDEWLIDLYDYHLEQLNQATVICTEKRERATRRYSR